MIERIEIWGMGIIMNRRRDGRNWVWLSLKREGIKKFEHREIKYFNGIFYFE
jgi:hypothetical protein